MRVAVLSDIHANLPALESVLAEVDRAGADRVVLLGDIALGPLPAETLDLLRSQGERMVWVHGNCEREMVEAFDTGRATAESALIDRSHRDLLDGLPLTVTLDVDGLGPVLFCHATPRRDDEVVLVDSPLPAWRAALAGVTVPTVVCGHTHMPFDRLVDGTRVVNPGSVGMAYGPPGAFWATLGPDVVLRRAGYDAEAAAARIRQGRHPEAEAWSREYVLEPPGDSEALAVFTEAVGRPRP